MQFSSEIDIMNHALELAARGEGGVEPNPMVGAIVVDGDGNFIAEGYHQKFGGPHAEVHALNDAGPRARGADLFVTLEPCNHTGQTPPCTDAILNAGIRRVVAAIGDQSPHANGAGFQKLRDAGVIVETSVAPQITNRANDLIAPFCKRLETGMPWVIAKWAMTLDGKIASRTGHSQWISGEESRRLVHQIRGNMDAIIVGAGTARADDPQLTARPPGQRTATRVVLDQNLTLPPKSQLVQTARDTPVLVFCGSTADAKRRELLENAGVELSECPENPTGLDLQAALKELGRRGCTNVLVEGGGQLLGSLFDAQIIDEVCVFIAQKLVGGEDAATPIAGRGLDSIPETAALHAPSFQLCGSNVCIRGRLN